LCPFSNKEVSLLDKVISLLFITLTLPVLDCEYYRKQAAEHIETLHSRDKLHSIYNTHSEMQTLKFIKTKFKNNEAMIANAEKGNSIVILPIQHYNMKIHNWITDNHFQTVNIDPTNTFQNQIWKTLNHSKTLIPQNFKWKCLNLNPSAPTIKGLRKIHKSNQPISPIVNWQNAPAYKLSKLFTHKINQLTPLPYIFNFKNTTQLIQAFKDTPLPPGINSAS